MASFDEILARYEAGETLSGADFSTLEKGLLGQRKDIFEGTKEEGGPTMRLAELLRPEAPLPILPFELEAQPVAPGFAGIASAVTDPTVVFPTIGELAGPPGAGIGGVMGKGVEFTQAAIRGEPTPDVIPMLKQMGAEGLKQFLFSKGARLLFKGTKGGVFKKQLEPGAEEALKVVERGGESITTARVTRQNFADNAEAILDTAFGSRGIMMKHAGRVENILDDAIEVVRTNMSPGEAGQFYADALEHNETWLRKLAQKTFDRSDELMGIGTREKIIVDIVESPILGPTGRPFAKEVTKKVIEVTGAPVKTQGLKRFATEGSAKVSGIEAFASESVTLKKILALGDTITFGQAQRLRTAFMDEVRDVLSPGIAEGMIKQFSKTIDRAMEQAAKKVSPEARTMWRAANELWKQKSEIFGTKFMRRLFKQDLPEQVYKSIVAGRNPTLIDRIRRAAPQAISKLKNAGIEDVISNSPATDQIGISGNSLMRKLVRGADGRYWKKLLGKETHDNLKVLARALQFQQSKPAGPGGTAVMLIQSGVALGALTALAASEADIVPIGRKVPLIVGGVVLVLPPIAAKLATKPGVIRWLTIGVTELKGTRRGAMAAARVLRATREIEKEEARRKLPTEPVVPLQGPLAPIGPSLPQPQSATPTAVFGVRG